MVYWKVSIPGNSMSKKEAGAEEAQHAAACGVPPPAVTAHVLLELEELKNWASCLLVDHGDNLVVGDTGKCNVHVLGHE